MRLRNILAPLVIAAALPLSAGEFFCKRYDFLQEQYIQLDAKAGEVALRDIRFRFPAYVGPRKLDIKGRNQAEVSIKNYGDKPMRIHVAIALFDEAGNLVGCGATGSKLGSTKRGEEETFFVTFDYVKDRLSAAKVFYLTVEAQPAL